MVIAAQFTRACVANAVQAVNSGVWSRTLRTVTARPCRHLMRWAITRSARAGRPPSQGMVCVRVVVAFAETSSSTARPAAVPSRGSPVFKWYATRTGATVPVGQHARLQHQGCPRTY
jgi:hypothetical protein